VLRLKGRGFTRSDGSRGDQLIMVMVDLPADDPALRDFVAGWTDTRDLRGALGA
jgi:hypothetical protein